MTKADIVNSISDQLGIDKTDVQITVEKFMSEIKNSLESGENVYLRGFGSFIVKTRAEKTGRNISKNVAVNIPAHNVPAFKPAKIFVNGVKSKVEVAQFENNKTKFKAYICLAVKKENGIRLLLIKEKREEEQTAIRRISVRIFT